MLQQKSAFLTAATRRVGSNVWVCSPLALNRRVQHVLRNRFATRPEQTATGAPAGVSSMPPSRSPRRNHTNTVAKPIITDRAATRC